MPVKDRGKENLFKMFIFVEIFCFESHLRDPLIDRIEQDRKVGNSFRFWLHCAFLWNHPVLADIFAYCYCDIETQHKLTENQSFVKI